MIIKLKLRSTLDYLTTWDKYTAKIDLDEILEEEITKYLFGLNADIECDDLNEIQRRVRTNNNEALSRLIAKKIIKINPTQKYIAVDSTGYVVVSFSYPIDACHIVHSV